MNNSTNIKFKTIWLALSMCALAISLFAVQKSNKNIEKLNHNTNKIEQNIQKIALLKQNQSQEKLDIQNAVSELKKLHADEIEQSKTTSIVSIQWTTEQQFLTQQIISLAKNGCTVNVLTIKPTNAKQLKIQTNCST